MVTMMGVVVVLTDSGEPLELVDGSRRRGWRQRCAHRKLAALERRRSVARHLALVNGRMLMVDASTEAAATASAAAAAAAEATATVAAVSAATAADVDWMVPATHPHASRKEQLEEQPLKLLAEYHVDDEVHGRVDCHQQIADFDQLVHRDAVERLGHVRY